MRQATGGGGGIGIYICRSHEEVVSQYSVASRQGKANFGDAGEGLSPGQVSCQARPAVGKQARDRSADGQAVNTYHAKAHCYLTVTSPVPAPG